MSTLTFTLPKVCPQSYVHKVHSTMFLSCWTLSDWWPRAITRHPWESSKLCLLKSLSMTVASLYWRTKLACSVQSLIRAQLFVTPWIAARQASLSITNSWSSLKLMSIELVMPSSHLILCHPLLCLPSIFPRIRSFPSSQFFASGGQHIGLSASASFPPKKSQGWAPSEWTGWISLQSKGLSRVFSNTTVQKHQFFSAQLSSQSNSHIHTRPLEKP